MRSIQTLHTGRPLSPPVPIDIFKLIPITILDLEQNLNFQIFFISLKLITWSSILIPLYVDFN